MENNIVTLIDLGTHFEGITLIQLEDHWRGRSLDHLDADSLK